MKPLLTFSLFLLAGPVFAQSDAPLFGGSPSRNMVNTVDKNVPIDFSVEEDNVKKIKYTIEMGSKAYGGPVIANGKIYIGTNNSYPRDPKVKGNLAVLQCFDEKSGKFLWQITHPMPEDEIFKEVTGYRLGLASTPAVDGDMLFYVTPDAKVVGASTSGKVVWTLDMMEKLKVVPFHCSTSSPLVVDDLVFLVTGNGIDEATEKVPSPKAPSFIALRKKDGAVAWQSNLPGDKIIEGQWTNPTLAVVDGKKQIIFPGGDGVIYSFKPEDGSLIWKFNCHPQGFDRTDSPVPLYFVSTPVAHEKKIYIGMGTQPVHPKQPRHSFFLCIDATRSGDISPKSLDKKADDNKDSGLLWSFGGAIEPRPKKGRPVRFGPTISTAAVHDGLVFISEESGYLHCLDAKTGEPFWVHDVLTAIWGSPYVVDGKVLLGVEDGVLHVLKADKKLEVLAKIDMEEMIHSTPVVANGVLYVSPRGKLYAIANGK